MVCSLVPWVPFCPLHLCLFPVPQVETTFPAHLGQSKKAGIAPGPHPIDGVLVAQLAPCPGAGSPYLRFPQELPPPSRISINSWPVMVSFS